MATITITPRGPFSLAASARFLEGFAPARYQGHALEGAVRRASPADDGHSTVGAAVRQAADGTVLADLAGDAEPAAAAAQLGRVFSLDIDGSGFAQVAEADPVVAGLAARYPGLRPVCFGSPYEAAAWAVIGHRIRITQAAAIKERIAGQYGQHLTAAGTPPWPTPSTSTTPAPASSPSSAPGGSHTEAGSPCCCAPTARKPSGIPTTSCSGRRRTPPLPRGRSWWASCPVRGHTHRVPRRRNPRPHPCHPRNRPNAIPRCPASSAKASAGPGSAHRCA